MKHSPKPDTRGQVKAIATRVIAPVLFFTGVVASYQGALREIGWLGPLIVGLIVLFELFRNKATIKPKLYVILYTGIVGFAMETLVISVGIYSVSESSRWLLPAPLAPLWIVALWANYAVRVPELVGFLRGRHFLNALMGFLFALVVFSSASNLGLVHLTFGWGSLVLTGLFWGPFVMTIYMVAERHIRISSMQ